MLHKYKVTARNIYTNDFFTSKSVPEQTPVDKRILYRVSQEQQNN